MYSGVFPFSVSPTTNPFDPLEVVLSVGVAVVVVVGQEEVLVGAVAGKGDGRDAEAGEGSLEPVESREGALVSPGLSVVSIVSGCRGVRQILRAQVPLTLSPKGRIWAGRPPP